VLKGEFPAQTLLELAVDYVRWGRETDAKLLLRLAANDGTESRPPIIGTPILQAWLAWLEEDPLLLRRDPAWAASALDPAFSHPYRPETIPVLKWAVSRSPDWEWTYFLALNLWALDRREEAASLFQELGSEPNFGPFYVARAYLLDEAAGVDPEADLRRAVMLDPETRILREHLIRYYQARGQWQASLNALADTRQRFPDSFELDLLEAGALNHVGRPEEAVALLEATHVLPSEGARESHRLYEQAHLLSALNALESGQASRARDHLLAALEWPESLGQGRPYDPEERMARFLLGLASMELGLDSDGIAQFDLVTENTDNLGAVAYGADARPPENALDLLAVPSLQILRRYGEMEALDWATSSPGEMVSWFRAEFPQLFQGLDGTILSRALDRYTEVVR
jgi:thioredoxin-like negative regulator of GroEL